MFVLLPFAFTADIGNVKKYGVDMTHLLKVFGARAFGNHLPTSLPNFLGPSTPVRY
jgi:hypothetical protein